MRLIPRLVLALLCSACFGEPPSDDGGESGSGSSGSGPTTSVGSASMSTTDPSSTTMPGTSASTDPTTDVTTDATTDPTETTTSVDTSTGEPGETVVLDVAAEACSATWRNDEMTDIQCPTPRYIDMMMTMNPAWSLGHLWRAVDDGIHIEATMQDLFDGAMATHPRFHADGWIIGRYPKMLYPDDALFRARVICAQAMTCEAVVYVGTSIEPDAAPEWLDQWDVSDVAYPDGRDIEVALNNDGLETEVILAVESGQMSGSDTIVWIEPRVVDPG